MSWCNRIVFTLLVSATMEIQDGMQQHQDGFQEHIYMCTDEFGMSSQILVMQHAMDLGVAILKATPDARSRGIASEPR